MSQSGDNEIGAAKTVSNDLLRARDGNDMLHNSVPQAGGETRETQQSVATHFATGQYC